MVGALTGKICLRVGKGVGCSECGNEPSCSIKCGVKESVAGSYGERCDADGCHRRLPKGAPVTLQG